MYLILGLYIGFYIGFLVTSLLSESSKTASYKHANRLDGSNIQRPTNPGKSAPSKCPDKVDADSIHEAIEYGDDTQVY